MKEMSPPDSSSVKGEAELALNNGVNKQRSDQNLPPHLASMIGSSKQDYARSAMPHRHSHHADADDEDDVHDGLDALGEALAGVSLAGSSTTSSFHASAFGLGNGVVLGAHENMGWGKYTSAGSNGNGAADTNSSKTNSNGSLSSTAASAVVHGGGGGGVFSSAGATTNSGSNGTGATASSSSGMPSAHHHHSHNLNDIGIDAHASNQGLGLFLSQSPSRTLGDDVFQLGNQHHHTSAGGLPSVSLNSERHMAPSTNSGDGSAAALAFRIMSGSSSLAPGSMALQHHSSSFGEIRPNNGASEARRRTESPSCSVTGTTTSSRSVSPNTNNNNINMASGGSDHSGRNGGASSINASSRGTIHSYHRYDSVPVANDTVTSSSTPGSASVAMHQFMARKQSSFAEDDRSSNSGGGGYNNRALMIQHHHGSHPNLNNLVVDSNHHRSPFGKDRNLSNGSSGGSSHSKIVSASNTMGPFGGGGIDAASAASSSYDRMAVSPYAPPPQQPLTPQYGMDGGLPLHLSTPLGGGAGGLNPIPHHVPTSSSGTVGAASQQQQQQQPQVLYMAVPSPDGRGQVLQPVQMLQLPGKPYTYVVPGNASLPSISQVDTSSLMGIGPYASSSTSSGGGMGDYGVLTGGGNGGLDSTLSPFDHRTRDLSYASEHGAFGSVSGADLSISSLPRDECATRSNSTSGLSASYSPGGGMDGVGTPFTTTDPALASLYASQHRPSLDSLLGQVRRLSRDQVGCRLVQQALDEEGPMAATLILNEGLPFWGEAMVDPFGNYLFQKILEKVTPDERVMLVRSVSSRLVNASLNLHGTRSVQKVVEVCADDEQGGKPEGMDETASVILTKALAPAAARLCIDSHGNHVIQRILLKLSPKHSKFVFDAVAASVGDVARHRHGCCVIQRCLDSSPSEARSHLVRRIVDKALELMQDAYGNYVVQYVLDVCSNEDVGAVCESVVGKVNLLAIQKFSSNVMEKCLERCSDRVKEMYLMEMSDPDRIRELMMDPFGNYVVQRALSVATHSQAIRLVEAVRPHLIATQTTGPNGQRNGGVRNTAGGRRIIAKICRRFPNFTLSALGSPEELYSQNKGGGGGPGGHQHHHRHHHHHHHHHGGHAQHAPQPPPQAASLASYAPVGPPNTAHVQHFALDPRMGPQNHLSLQPPPQQSQLSTSAVSQPSYYNIGMNTYYDPFSNGHLGGAGGGGYSTL